MWPLRGAGGCTGEVRTSFPSWKANSGNINPSTEVSRRERNEILFNPPIQITVAVAGKIV
jgi:hypothetical protein